MAINSLSRVVPNTQYQKSNLNFKQNGVVSLDETFQDTYEPQYYLKPKAGKKLGMVFTSLNVVGGHIANGQFGKAILAGLGIGAGAIGTYLGTVTLATSSNLKMQKAALPVGIAAGALTLAGYIWNIVDSVKSSTEKIDIVEA